MVSIAFVNQKGGVSKTASTANLAAIFAGEFKKRVLAVDCDAQANLTYYLTKQMKGNVSFANALKARLDPETFTTRQGDNKEDQKRLDHFDDLRECLIPVTFFWKGRDVNVPLSLVPGCAELDYYFNSADINTMKNFINSLSNDYDVCLLDCSPQKTSYNMLAIAASDYIMIPMDPNVVNQNGIELVNTFVKQVNNMAGSDARILGMFFTMIDSRGKIHQKVMDMFNSGYGKLMFKSTIRQARILQESYNVASPIYYYARQEKVCKDYIALAREMMSRLREKGEKI